jgi:hypothetical protein
MYEQEVAARPRDRKVLTPQEITKATRNSSYTLLDEKTFAY